MSWRDTLDNSPFDYLHSQFSGCPMANGAPTVCGILASDLRFAAALRYRKQLDDLFSTEGQWCTATLRILQPFFNHYLLLSTF